MLNATKIALPRHERAISQICQLERSVQRSGRDQITHPTHGHDDVACAIAGAVDLACNASSYSLDAFQPGFQDLDAPPQPAQQGPELSDVPLYNGDWWRWRGVPRSQPTFSADERLRALYESIDFACKSGFFR